MNRTNSKSSMKEYQCGKLKITEARSLGWGCEYPEQCSSLGKWTSCFSNSCKCIPGARMSTQGTCEGGGSIPTIVYSCDIALVRGCICNHVTKCRSVRIVANETMQSSRGFGNHGYGKPRAMRFSRGVGAVFDWQFEIIKPFVMSGLLTVIKDMVVM
uniref:EB domain-containing protein n=1 Tax=Timema tahoe TaxID=61484 RepID=A0A7R9INV1_9NEOP|nr:unnamed protein product [Timema tahoe]